MKSEEGQGFSGQVCIVADSIGSILAYDALCRTMRYQSRHGSENSILDNDVYSHKGKHNFLMQTHIFQSKFVITFHNLLQFLFLHCFNISDILYSG